MPRPPRPGRRAALLLALLPALTSATARAHDYRAGDLSIGHPWSRPAPSGGTGVGYMTLRNGGGAAERLLSAASPAARAVELHTHIRDGDVMRMRPVADVPIPPGGMVAFEPGGLHLMLIGLARPLREGERVPLTLSFARAGRVEVELVVESMRARPDAGGGDHGGHHRH